jgi:hypothetical protein
VLLNIIHYRTLKKLTNIKGRGDSSKRGLGYIFHQSGMQSISMAIFSESPNSLDFIDQIMKDIFFTTHSS